ncbi:MAG: TatD family hydrolase [Spirochaetaceae bacterium]|jgi:TatD DNase family protein|nr:TatD family hydrolase [Spirochaetaceae bacterium]
MNCDYTGFTDTHAHLSYLKDRGVPLEGLPEALAGGGFGFILDIGTDAGDIEGRIATLSRYPNVRFATGVWPYSGQICRIQENADALEKNLTSAPPGLIVAIGECGFDFRENPQEPAEETAFLEMQLTLAQKYSLPIIIHSREAPRRTLETLRRFPAVRGVIHCFSYTKEEARLFLDMGYYISFAGNLTFKNAQPLREACAMVSAGRLLLETDSPFLAPAPWRGKPCHPGMIAETYRLAAELRGISLDNLKTLISANARALFALD